MQTKTATVGATTTSATILTTIEQTITTPLTGIGLGELNPYIAIIAVAAVVLIFVTILRRHFR